MGVSRDKVQQLFRESIKEKFLQCTSDITIEGQLLIAQMSPAQLEIFGAKSDQLAVVVIDTNTLSCFGIAAGGYITDFGITATDFFNIEGITVAYYNGVHIYYRDGKVLITKKSIVLTSEILELYDICANMDTDARTCIEEAHYQKQLDPIIEANEAVLENFPNASLKVCNSWNDVARILATHHYKIVKVD